MKIAYNAGHILATPGKRVPEGLDGAGTREWVLNDRVARYFAAEMSRYRDVELRRLDDPEGIKPLDIDARVAQANLWPADFYLSIHHNAAGRIFDGGGVEVYLDAPADRRRLMPGQFMRRSPPPPDCGETGRTPSGPGWKRRCMKFGQP